MPPTLHVPRRHKRQLSIARAFRTGTGKALVRSADTASSAPHRVPHARRGIARRMAAGVATAEPAGPMGAMGHRQGPDPPAGPGWLTNLLAESAPRHQKTDSRCGSFTTKPPRNHHAPIKPPPCSDRRARRAALRPASLVTSRSGRPARIAHRQPPSAGPAWPSAGRGLPAPISAHLFTRRLPGRLAPAKNPGVPSSG